MVPGLFDHSPGRRCPHGRYIFYFSDSDKKKKAALMAEAKAVVKKRGNKLGFWFFQTSLRIFGLAGTYGLLYLVCLYYMIFDRLAVSASRAYIKRRFKSHNAFQQLCDVYKLFIQQGKNLIDRYYVVSGEGQFDTELYGYDKIKTLLNDSQKGVILLTAHVGNWQLAMTALKKFGRTVHLLMRPEDNIAVRETLDIDSEKENVKIISTENFLGGVIEAMDAVNKGHIVSIMGDRPYQYSSVEASFLGEKVSFPYGAFSIAAAAQCPVVILLSAKVSTKKYIVDISHVIEPRY
ncbi:MAG: hypothetical protein EPN94_07615, partial [Nitrospirae bacterium]